MLTEKFSTKEQDLLEERLHSYGAKAECVRLTGVRYAAIQKVLNTGEATPAVLSKLRMYIYNIPTRVFVEAA
jgi:hypothetical protein